MKPLTRFKAAWMLSGWNLAGTGALLSIAIAQERGIAAAAILAAARSAGWIAAPAIARAARKATQSSILAATATASAIGRASVFVAHHQEGSLALMCTIEAVTQAFYALMVACGKQAAHAHRGSLGSSANQASLTLWGGIGSAAAVAQAGAHMSAEIDAGALLAIGIAYSLVGALPTALLAPLARVNGSRAGAERDAGLKVSAHEMRRQVTNVAARQSIIGGMENVSVAAAALWHSSRVAGATRTALLIGQVAAVKVAEQLERRPARERDETLLLAIGAAPLALAQTHPAAMLSWLILLGASQRAWQASAEARLLDLEEPLTWLIAGRAGGSAISTAWVGSIIATAGPAAAAGIAVAALGAMATRDEKRQTQVRKDAR